MAASRQVGRTAFRLSNFIGSNSQLRNSNGPSYMLWKGNNGTKPLGASTSLLHQLPPQQFILQACGYCSQQVAHASFTCHTCSPALTSSHTPAPVHIHTATVRRINRRTELDFEELSALQMAGDIALIDVRDVQELRSYGEIPGSLNIPLCKIKGALQLSEDEWEREFHMEKPDKGDRNLVFYARGPNASSTAVEIAHRLGFKRSRHYIGGWEDYCQQTGVPLKKPQDDFSASGNYYVNRLDQYFL